MEAVCIMLNIKPERKPEPGTGRMFDDYWGPSVKLLSDMKFLDRLKTYEKDNILPATIKRIRDKYVTSVTFLMLIRFFRYSDKLKCHIPGFCLNSTFRFARRRHARCLDMVITTDL